MFRQIGSMMGYEPQNASNQERRPFKLTFRYALTILVYALAVYAEAVLIGALFGPVLLGIAIAQLLHIERSGRGITVGVRDISTTRRILAGVALATGLLFCYLRITDAMPIVLERGGDGTVLIGTVKHWYAIPPAWEAVRWGLAIVIPLALIPAGVELLARILMEIGAPNLADSIRAATGMLKRGRWINYAGKPAETAAEVSTPVANWSK